MTEDNNLENKVGYFLNKLDEISQKADITLIDKLDSVLKEFNVIIPVDAAQILLLNEDKKLVTIVFHNLDKPVRDLRYRIGEGAIGKAFEERKVLVTGNLKESRWNEQVKTVYEDLGSYKEMYSVLVGGFREGVIELLSKQKDWFSREDIKNISTILPGLSLFIEAAVKDRNHALDKVMGYYTLLESKHGEYAGHARRVQEEALCLFKLLKEFESTKILENLNSYECDLDSFESRLSKAAFLHDIGKIKFQDDLLDSTASFARERNPFRDHTIFGYNILKENGVTDQVILDGVYHHHQNYDGTGYPAVDQGTKIAPLSGSAIPYVARILHIVDVYDALTSERYYRPTRNEPVKYEPEQAIGILRKHSLEFDPFIMDTFIKMIESKLKEKRMYR